VAALIGDRSEIARFAGVLQQKYAAEWLEDVYTLDFFDASVGGGATYRITPSSVFALNAAEFSTSPTRWTF
jgi:hypothetical protein